MAKKKKAEGEWKSPYKEGQAFNTIEEPISREERKQRVAQARSIRHYPVKPAEYHSDVKLPANPHMRHWVTPRGKRKVMDTSKHKVERGLQKVNWYLQRKITEALGDQAAQTKKVLDAKLITQMTRRPTGFDVSLLEEHATKLEKTDDWFESPLRAMRKALRAERDEVWSADLPGASRFYLVKGTRRKPGGGWDTSHAPRKSRPKNKLELDLTQTHSVKLNARKNQDTAALKELLFPFNDGPGRDRLNFVDSFAKSVGRDAAYTQGRLAWEERERVVNQIMGDMKLSKTGDMIKDNHGLRRQLKAFGRVVKYGTHAAVAKTAHGLYKNPSLSVRIKGYPVRLPLVVGLGIATERLHHWSTLGKDPYGLRRHRDPRHNPRYWANQPFTQKLGLGKVNKKQKDPYTGR